MSQSCSGYGCLYKSRGSVIKGRKEYVHKAQRNDLFRHNEIIQSVIPEYRYNWNNLRNDISIDKGMSLYKDMSLDNNISIENDIPKENKYIPIENDILMDQDMLFENDMPFNSPDIFINNDFENRYLIDSYFPIRFKNKFEFSDNSFQWRDSIPSNFSVSNRNFYYNELLKCQDKHKKSYGNFLCSNSYHEMNRMNQLSNNKRIHQMSNIKMRSEMSNGKMRSEISNEKERSEIFNGKMKSQMSDIKMRSQMSNGKVGSEMSNMKMKNHVIETNVYQKMIEDEKNESLFNSITFQHPSDQEYVYQNYRILGLFKIANTTFKARLFHNFLQRIFSNLSDRFYTYYSKCIKIFNPFVLIAAGCYLCKFLKVTRSIGSCHPIDLYLVACVLSSKYWDDFSGKLLHNFASNTITYYQKLTDEFLMVINFDLILSQSEIYDFCEWFHL